MKFHSIGINEMIELPDSKYLDFFQYVVGRNETQLLSDDELAEKFRNQRILIIGAGGSIGSAIARRLVTAQIPNLYFLDRDESALHGLALSLSDRAASLSANCSIADIRDSQSVRDVIESVRPTIVVHAAALKHLVILERFPREGYLTNVIGTLNVAEICVELGVPQFVNISTDKAANPISVLGKTKKIAELLTEEVFLGQNLKQCSVRFGNVFASRGSVIETFIHQIRKGLPVTITDENVGRFFMSRNEAANLVLASASLRESGTYIQNMGDEVPIADVVARIAAYLNIVPKLKIIGLQPGEKMHEELFDNPATATKYASISRSIQSFQHGLVSAIKDRVPANNLEALAQIEEHISTSAKEI
jgi:FlaA1/EpsC-like NDP-sugar epimerase